MPESKSTPPRRTRDDWVDAAFVAATEGGLDAVAVEPVAKRLGATKGSFYWHFKDRSALVDAVLERWLHQTTLIISQLAEIPDPKARLAALFGSVFENQHWAVGETDLFARVRDPAVSRAVQEAHTRRLGFIASSLREIGLSKTDAEAGARQAYALWLGSLQLSMTLPELTDRDRRRFNESTLALFKTIYDRAEN